MELVHRVQNKVNVHLMELPFVHLLNNFHEDVRAIVLLNMMIKPNYVFQRRVTVFCDLLFFLIFNTFYVGFFLGLGSLCNEQADECTARAPNTACSTNLCLCKEKFIEINGQCKPGQNAACSIDNDCVLNNAHCSPNENVCKCKSGFVYAKESCLKEGN